MQILIINSNLDIKIHLLIRIKKTKIIIIKYIYKTLII